MDMRGIFGSFGSFGGFDSHAEEAEADFEDVLGEPPPPLVDQDERRMQVRAYNHWASMLGERNFPAIEDLHPGDLPDCGPYSVLLDFSNGIENPSVPFLGDQLAMECGAQFPISRLSDVPGRSLLSRITAHYMQILANQAPIGFEAEFVNARGLTVLYRGILLPFSSNDRTIDYIYGVINWKEAADQQTADALLLEIDGALAARPAAMPDAGRARPVAAPTLASVLDPDGTGDDYIPAEWSKAPIDLTGRAEDHAEGEETDERLPSLMAMRMDKGIRRKAPAVLNHGVRFAAPLMRQTVNAPMPLLGEYQVEALDIPHSTEAFAAASTSNAFGLGDGGDGGCEWTGGNLPVPLAGAGAAPPVQADTPAAMLQRIAVAMGADGEPDGLRDCLASARELADSLRHSEDRTRATLYRAISRAYDVSLAAADAPEEFAELLAGSGLAMQDRAPMTPVVKLIFGADYDKTRIAEYAAVLAHARRRGVGRGELRDILQGSAGGLKAIVAEERRLRRAETRKSPGPAPVLPVILAERLRAAEPLGFGTLLADGAEFSLLMVRRLPSGELAVVGEVPEDTRLLEKAARRLLG